MTNIDQIPIITVSYNSPDLILTLLSSTRKFYKNKIYIIDGSDDKYIDEIRAVTLKFDNVEFIPFFYNIHHGPGMAWAITNLKLSGPVLFLDSDIEILANGLIEELSNHLTPELYGVGSCGRVNEGGYDGEEAFIKYIHPACMLCNIDVMKKWPLPIKHGAPMIQVVLALRMASSDHLIHHVDCVGSDLQKGTTKIFFNHEWQGTVNRTGSYNLDAKDNSQALEGYNQTLLSLIPLNATNVIEVGCNDGALARAYKQLNPTCSYTGIEINKRVIDIAINNCDFVLDLNIEAADEMFFEQAQSCDCWIFGDVLEHLIDPWALLKKIRKVMPTNGVVLACIPNAQHWSVQKRLNSGEFKYEQNGLMDRTHLRWFTRVTIFEMFQTAGYSIAEGVSRTFSDPAREQFLPAIRMMAECSGLDPESAVRDSLPMQYVVKAVPNQ